MCPEISELKAEQKHIWSGAQTPSSALAPCFICQELLCGEGSWKPTWQPPPCPAPPVASTTPGSFSPRLELSSRCCCCRCLGYPGPFNHSKPEPAWNINWAAPLCVPGEAAKQLRAILCSLKCGISHPNLDYSVVFHPRVVLTGNHRGKSVLEGLEFSV